MIYRTPDKQEYPEYTKFPRYHAPCTVDYVPLLVGDNRVRFYALSTLVEVKSPFETGMLYGCELPPRSIVLWRPVITLTPSIAAQVNHAVGVQIEVRVAA